MQKKPRFRHPWLKHNLKYFNFHFKTLERVQIE